MLTGDGWLFIGWVAYCGGFIGEVYQFINGGFIGEVYQFIKRISLP